MVLKTKVPDAAARRTRIAPMPTLELYRFRFRDPLTGKWVRTRHKLQVPEIQRHYSDWVITGAPEIRHVTETSTQPFEPPAPARAYCALVSAPPL
jgi:hypothetical protein